MRIPAEIRQAAMAYHDDWGTDLVRLIEQVLAQDPRPAYQSPDPDRVYGMQLCGFDLRWRYPEPASIEVVALESQA